MANKNTNHNTITMISTRNLEPGTLCLEVEPPPGWERGTARCVLRSRIICRSWRSQNRPQHCIPHQSPDSFEEQKKTRVQKKHKNFDTFICKSQIVFLIFTMREKKNTFESEGCVVRDIQDKYNFGTDKFDR